MRCEAIQRALLAQLRSCGGKSSCTESQSLGVKDMQRAWWTWWTWCEALELATQTGLAAWGFFLQARMKEVECSRYRQGHARMDGP